MILLQSPPSDIRSNRRTIPSRIFLFLHLPLRIQTPIVVSASIRPSLSYTLACSLALSPSLSQLSLSPPPYERRTPQDSKGSRPSSCFGCPPLPFFISSLPVLPLAFTRIYPIWTSHTTNLPSHKGSTHSHISLAPDNCNILDTMKFFRFRWFMDYISQLFPFKLRRNSRFRAPLIVIYVLVDICSALPTPKVRSEPGAR